MSFSYDTKIELSAIAVQKVCCARAEAYGILLYCNTFSSTEVRIVTENPHFAARLPKLFHKAFGIRFDRQPEEEQQGKLVFQITTAGGAIPLEGAEITLRASRSASDGNGGEVMAVLYSDSNGKSEVLTLPAPARMLSLEPARDGAPVPYALYNADVKLRGFYSQSYIRIPIFDGITSIQRASLIPLPENGFEGGTRPDGEKFYEGESPDL